MTATNGQIVDDNGNVKATYRLAIDGTYVVNIKGLAASIIMSPERFKEFLDKGFRR